MDTSFHWQDPLRLDLQLNNQEKNIQQQAHDYAQKFLAPRIQKAFREEYFDSTIMQELGEQGFLGANLQGYGCLGLNHICYGLIAKELERVDSGFRTIFSVQSSLAMQAIYAHGSETQKNYFLPDMAKGKLIGCFGLTEPNHGSDPASMETHAKKTQGGYILNGHKKWIGLAVFADVLIIWAKDENNIIRGFILEKDFQGIATNLIAGKFSLRAAPTCEIHLKNVFVPDDHVLEKAEGLKAPFACLNKARFSIAWGVLGAAENCWHTARDYVLQRQQFNKPLASNQLIQKKLADMQTDIAIAQQAALRATQLLDQEICVHETISLIKRHNAKIALEIALTARDMLGANGIIDEHPIIRHLVNLLAVNTYEGTADIHALILGRSQTNIGAF